MNFEVFPFIFFFFFFYADTFSKFFNKFHLFFARD